MKNNYRSAVEYKLLYIIIKLGLPYGVFTQFDYAGICHWANDFKYYKDFQECEKKLRLRT